MFGLFKKKTVDRNALIFIFLKIIGNILASNRKLTKELIEREIDSYLIQTKSKLSNEQMMILSSAINIFCLDPAMQEKMLKLHYANELETKILFLDIQDEFQSYGIFT